MKEKQIKCPLCGAIYTYDDLDTLGLELDPMDTNDNYNVGTACCPECGCEFTVKATVEYQVIE